MGKKRSEKRLGGAVAVKPAPVAVALKVAERTISALCPICGRAIPQERAIKEGYVVVGHTPYFQSINWLSDKPFGISRMAAGRGSFSSWEYLDPQGAPELFEALKGRFEDAIKEWLQRGWFTPAEIRELLKEFPSS